METTHMLQLTPKPSNSAPGVPDWRTGLVARKTRGRRNSVDNHGGFQLINPDSNWIVAGDLRVIDYCEASDR
jgi:hypothetical protein